MREEYDRDADGASSGDTDTYYVYDLAGNRINLLKDDFDSDSNLDGNADTTTVYSYGANDRLLNEVTDAPGTSEDTNTTYAWGSSGNATTQTGKTVREGLTPGSGTVTLSTTMAYDARGRLAEVAVNDGTTTVTSSYAYNNDGIRVSQTVDDGTNPAVTTLYLIDSNNHTGYAQTLEEGVDANDDGVLDASEVDKVYVLGHDVIAQAAKAALSDGVVTPPARQVTPMMP